MNELILFLASFLYTCALGIGLGLRVINLAFYNLSTLNFQFKVGAAYFIGLALLTAGYRFFDFLIDSSFLTSLLTLASFSFLVLAPTLKPREFVKDYSEVMNIKVFLINVFIIFFFSILIFFFWSPSSYIDEPFNPLGFFGSLHSVKYAWISNFIEVCNEVPVLGQNTLQSTLISILGSLVKPFPFVGLFLFLVGSIYFFGIFLFGFFKEITNKTVLSSTLSFFVLFGNTALSLSPVLVIDSGSPIGLSGYSDTVFGAFSIVFFFYLYRFMGLSIKTHLSLFFLIFILLIGTFLSAPQNIILISIFIFIIFFSKVSNRKEISINFFFLLFLSSIFAIPMGGMLTPEFFQTEIYYSGLVSPPKDISTLEIAPGYPYLVGGSINLIWDQSLLVSDLKLSLEKGWLGVFESIWILEKIIFNSIRVLLIPILGVVIFTILKKKLIDDLINQSFYDLNSLSYFGLISLVIGLLICFTIEMGGYKWEFVRFMIPSIIIGQILFSLLMLRVYNLNKLIFSAILVFLTIGPISNLFLGSYENYREMNFNNYKQNDFLIIFTSEGPEVQEAQCN